MSEQVSHRFYVTIWATLLALVAVGVLLIAVPASKPIVLTLVFGVAAIKAFLVLRHFMHLRGQPPVLYVIIAVPVVLAIAFTLALLPDIGFRP